MKRRRKRKADPDASWEINVNKKRRTLGLSYSVRKYNTKTKKWDLVPRPTRRCALSSHARKNVTVFVKMNQKQFLMISGRVVVGIESLIPGEETRI